VSGSSKVGGLVGNQLVSNTITNAYAVGSVSGGASNVGGLVGSAGSSSILNSFAAASVSTTSSPAVVGGFIGWRNDIRNSYWYNFAENPNVGAGFPDSVVGLKAIINNNYFKGAVKSKGPFNSWDFNIIWQENANDYPTLRGFP